MTSGQSKQSKDILGHWLWAVPVLLIVAALTFRQIDLDPPTADEFYSMYNAGWLVNGPYSPIDVMQSLQRYSPNHTPGYFILLSIWGNLIGYDIALGRMLTIFSGLLSLAMTYRLARDFVAPVAGLFALIIVASNAFYNFYIVHVRMYPLLVFTAGIALWLYLRITYQQKRAKRRDYVALGAAVFALINTHAFSALFLAMLGLYHLLIAPKNRRWRRVSAAVLIAALLFSPWAVILLSSGIDRTAEHWGNFPPLDSWGGVNVWFTLALNNQPGLLLLSAAGLALAIWKKKIAFKPYLIMFIFFLLTLALAAELTALVITPNMRHQLVSWLPFVLFAAAGFYSLYCFRKWLGLLVLLWVIAGAAFQRTPDWSPYVHDQEYDQAESPVQVISRLALQAEQQPMIIGYRYARFLLTWRPNRINYSQREHYFDRHHLTLKLISDLDALVPYVRNRAITSPSQWIFHQTSKTSAAEAAEIESIMRGLNYQPCETVEIGIDTVIAQYLWQTLNCQPPQLLSSHQTDAIDYQFYGAALDAAHSKLLFSDQWTARTDDDLDNYKMSYQLITSDWNNVAQLDLPLVRPGELRQFSIDISNVPAGTHRLMAILYDKRTGERQNWLNSAEDLPTMLTLTEIIIP